MKRRRVRVEVSDHAVLRWLEREHGLDVQAVKDAIAGTVRSGAELGAVGVCIGNVRFLLRDTRDGRVGDVTVVSALRRKMPVGDDRP